MAKINNFSKRLYVTRQMDAQGNVWYFATDKLEELENHDKPGALVGLYDWLDTKILKVEISVE